MSEEKTNSELISSIKKMNKVAREKFAIKKGFKSSIDYIKSLEIKSVLQPKSTGNKHIVYVADVLDTSGSMSGPKINGALEGINTGIKQLCEETKVKYLYSLVTFSDHSKISTKIKSQDPADVKVVSANAGGYTALYDAVATAIIDINKVKNKEDKALINIYTDGDENDSRKYNKTKISKLIKDSEKEGFTITFIGTVADTKRAIRDLSIKESNTLSYDGTAEGLSKGLTKTMSMRSSYASNLSEGKDVSGGFYKNINK